MQLISIDQFLQGDSSWAVSLHAAGKLCERTGGAEGEWGQGFKSVVIVASGNADFTEVIVLWHMPSPDLLYYKFELYLKALIY